MWPKRATAPYYCPQCNRARGDDEIVSGGGCGVCGEPLEEDWEAEVEARAIKEDSNATSPQ